MTEHSPTPDGEDAHEADQTGEKPDLGRKPDAMAEALSGSNVGSDTTAGSLRGGSAAGTENDPDQEAIDEMLATEGMAAAESRGAVSEDDDESAVRNTGEDEAEGEGERRGEADAATG